MTPTLIAEQHGTGNIQSERRIVEMKDTIAYLEPDASPLTIVLKRAAGKSFSTKNPKFSCLEAPVQPRWDAINEGSGYNPTDTGLTVDNGAYFAAEDLVKNPRTGEVFKVSSSSGNVLTVIRGYGTTAAASMDNNDQLLIIGNAHEEGAALGSIRTIQLEVFFNYTQIFRKPFGATETVQASALYGGSDLSVTRKLQGIEHMKDLERAFLFGERSEKTTSTSIATTTHPERTTGGILSFVTTNVKDVGTEVTETEFEDWLEDVFRYGS